MARYTGPRLKVMRALGADLPGLSRKRPERRPYPPGQHGDKRKKKSVYGTQLIEKQKVRYNYGLGERQLRRAVSQSFRKKGDPGKNLLDILERRLDNVVYCVGFAPSIAAARQLVAHGKILVNGKRVDVASYQTKQGEEISLTEKGKKMILVQSEVEERKATGNHPEWSRYDDASMTATLTSTPGREDFPFVVEIPMVIEYYSRLVK